MPENLPLFSLVIFSIFTELYHHRENFILLPQKETPYPSAVTPHTRPATPSAPGDP